MRGSRIRRSSPSFVRTTRTPLANGTVSRQRLPLRAAWQTITGRTCGYSISREDGSAAGTTAEFGPPRARSFADATTITGDARVYLPGLRPHHVVAQYAGGGASTGDPRPGARSCWGASTRAGSRRVRQRRLQPAARLRARNTFAGSRVAVAQRRSTGGRSRACSAASARGRCSCIRSMPRCSPTRRQAWTGRFARRIKTSAGAQLGRLRRRLLRAVHGHRRRRLGTRRQRPCRRSRDRLFPDRPGVLD